MYVYLYVCCYCMHCCLNFSFCSVCIYVMSVFFCYVYVCMSFFLLSKLIYLCNNSFRYSCIYVFLTLFICVAIYCVLSFMNLCVYAFCLYLLFLSLGLPFFVYLLYSSFFILRCLCFDFCISLFLYYCSMYLCVALCM